MRNQSCYVVTIAAINHTVGKQIINSVVTVTAGMGLDCVKVG